MRHLLGSIDLSDIEKLKQKGLTDAELRGRASDTEIFYERHFKTVLKLLMQAQLEWIALNADDEYKLQFGRGSFNALLVVMEWFDERVKEAMERFQPKEKPEPGESITPVGELKT